ncbi:MAG TPA: hypothetical protein VG722_11560, partial [Tepidisphaeraceae bacterium]|nr:hypothetical protein [Tepidisphaeraceae bacterium]
QGQPWDLMAWSFNGKFEDRSWTTKSIPQLQQEAAVVLSLGGGFQAYFSQKRDGSISLWQMNLMSEVAKFCRARQKYCHKAQPVPQIGLLFSTDALYRRSDRLFGPWTPQTDIVTGILQCLLESQNSVDLLSEHHLATRLRDYPLIVIPQWDYLKPAILSELRRYVERGGNLLLIGHQSASLFAAQLDVKFKIDTTDKLQWLEHEAWLACIKTRCSALKLGKTAKPFGKLYAQNDFVGPHQPPASITRLGKGKIAAIYFNLGEQYRIGANAVTRAFLQSIVRELFAAPMVEVTGSRYVDVAVNKINGKLAINLVNTAGPHADARVLVFDEIPPVGPLQISSRSDRKPARVTLRPEGKSLKFLYTKGKILLTLPILHIHSVIVIE